MTLTPDPDNVPTDPNAPTGDEPEYRDDGDADLQPKVYDIDDDEKDDEQDESADDGDESSQR